MKRNKTSIASLEKNALIETLTAQKLQNIKGGDRSACNSEKSACNSERSACNSERSACNSKRSACNSERAGN